MHERFAKSRIEEALADTRVVLISGPRQSGKTTLVTDIAAEQIPFFTLDDATVLAARLYPAPQNHLLIGVVAWIVLARM